MMNLSVGLSSTKSRIISAFCSLLLKAPRLTWYNNLMFFLEVLRSVGERFRNVGHALRAESAEA